MNTIIHFDTQLFLFLNGLHAGWLDPIMVFISSNWVPVVFYLAFFGLIISRYHKNWGWLLLGLVVLILLTDQISSHLIKPWIERLRPCQNPDIQSLVYLASGRCGGKYGFVSSHAANCFAAATYLFALLRPYFKKSWIPLFAWAVIVAYSRIYLGVHYPLDLLCGALLGALLGWLVHLGAKRLVRSR